MSVLRVVEPFACEVKGLPRVYRAGDLVSADDAVVKGRERFFVEVAEFAQRAAAHFEQATAGPGELRNGPRKAAKKAAPKSE